MAAALSDTEAIYSLSLPRRSARLKKLKENRKDKLVSQYFAQPKGSSSASLKRKTRDQKWLEGQIIHFDTAYNSS